LAIARSSELTGHVAGNTLRTLFSTAPLVLAALAMGFRPTVSPVNWLAVIGIVTLLRSAISWLLARRERGPTECRAPGRPFYG
jgi:ABC-2 type transport system permease protein